MILSESFMVDEIFKITNDVMLGYVELFRNGQISFHEYSIIENVMIRTQQAFQDKAEEKNKKKHNGG